MIQRSNSKWIYAAGTLMSLVAGAFWYHWWSSDERLIKKQLSTIAQSLTTGPNEGALGPVTRIATLRKAIASDVHLSAGGQEVVSRDALLALASQWIPPPGGVTVEFVDVQVTVGEDRLHADVYCTVTVTSRTSTSGEPAIDARELAIDFVEQDGAWLVSAVRTKETLAR